MLGFNRWHILKGLAAFLCIFGLISAALMYFIPAPPSTITIAVGFKGGAFEQTANIYQEKLARYGIKSNLHFTDGAPGALKLIENKNTDTDVAFLFGGVSNSAQSPGLVSLGRIRNNPIWVFYRGSESLDRLSQFKGKRIAVSFAFGPFEQILAANGITSANTIFKNSVGQAAFDALKNSEVDAFVSPQDLSSPIIQSALREPNIRVMNMAQAETLSRSFPYLNRLVLPQGAVDLEKNVPPTDINLIATTGVVVARKSLHPELIYLLARVMSGKDPVVAKY